MSPAAQTAEEGTLLAVPAKSSNRGPGGKLDLRALGRAELSAFVAELGEKPFRAKQIFRWMHQRGVRSLDEMTDLSKSFRARLAEVAEVAATEVSTVEVSRDGTRKYALRTGRGQIVEAVFIPDASAEGRNTLCISSQVGCAIDCQFCLTAALGLIRNLTAGEIAEQLLRVREDLKKAGEDREVNNLVMMGMGEPLQNYDALVQAIDMLSAEDGGAISARRMTVSTSGLVPRIPRLGKDTKVNLAVSLNATTDEVRDQIMPINKRWNIAQLLEACRSFPMPERRGITFEYVLLAGVNDSEDDARRLVRLLRDLPAKVNLIPFNEHPYSPFARPSERAIARFQRIVIDRGLTAFVRTPSGDDISAACGQLGVTVDGPKRTALPIVSS